MISLFFFGLSHVCLKLLKLNENFLKIKRSNEWSTSKMCPSRVGRLVPWGRDGTKHGLWNLDIVDDHIRSALCWFGKYSFKKLIRVWKICTSYLLQSTSFWYWAHWQNMKLMFSVAQDCPLEIWNTTKTQHLYQN